MAAVGFLFRYLNGPLPYVQHHITNKNVLSASLNKTFPSFFQAVLHDWCNKGCGMSYPIYGIVHIKEPLLLIGKSSICGGSRFPLTERSFTIHVCPMLYNHN